MVVVTRYYGGTKLGTGGLVRAYGAAAAAVLGEADIERRPVLVTFRLSHPYDLSGPVEGVLASHHAVVVDADYGERVTLRVRVPSELAATFPAALADATAGRVTATRT